MQFKLQPSMLKSCAPAMSTEETRYYLMGVHVFERNGQMIYEATNGHILVRCTATLEQENDFSGLNIIIPDFLVKELSKPSFLKGFGCIGGEYVDAVLDGCMLNIEMPNGIASNKIIDGTYPDTDNVFPQKKSGVNEMADLGFNTEYLSRIAKSAKAFNGSFICKVSATDASSPVYFTQNGDRGEWEALLMPCRV